MIKLIQYYNLGSNIKIAEDLYFSGRFSRILNESNMSALNNYAKHNGAIIRISEKQQVGKYTIGKAKPDSVFFKIRRADNKVQSVFPDIWVKLSDKKSEFTEVMRNMYTKVAENIKLLK